MKRFLPLLIGSFLFLCSCGSVTETGNPCQPEGCTESAEQQENIYQNDTYGVLVSYPPGWTEEETSFSAPSGVCDTCSPSDPAEGVIFSNAEARVSSASMYFDAITGSYTTLLSYLRTLYPAFSFSAYNTASLSGYVYDDPSVGTNGGDARDYFFSDGSTLVIVMAEVFSTGEDELETLLEGISFF